MKKLLLGAALLSIMSGPVFAKNFAIPADDPAATIALPDNWTLTEIEYGYSVVSPDKDIFFSVEYAGGKRLDGMKKLNDEWLKDNSIKIDDQPETIESDFNGIKGSILRFKAKDENGPTNVNFGIIPAGKGRVIMLTLWGSDEEQKAHDAEITKILGSLKPIQ
jgi:hypothetical protein